VLFHFQLKIAAEQNDIRSDNIWNTVGECRRRFKPTMEEEGDGWIWTIRADVRG